MSRVPQRQGVRGSLKAIQDLVTGNPDPLDQQISSLVNLREDIVWLSPRHDDAYAEYRDGDFLRLLGLSGLAADLGDFWPERGPQWDALGKAGGTILLVEAKSHISETITHCTASAASVTKIQKALNLTRRQLGITNKTNWMSPFYQYANRVAHLQFLLKRKIDAYLVFVNFVNDVTIPDPATEQEWQGAIKLIRASLGISKSFARKRIIDVFLDFKK